MSDKKNKFSVSEIYLSGNPLGASSLAIINPLGAPFLSIINPPVLIIVARSQMKVLIITDVNRKEKS